MSAVVASTVIAGASVIQGHMARRDAKKTAQVMAQERAAEQKKLDDQIAAEKRKRNEDIMSRLSRGGSAGTVFAGATGQAGKKAGQQTLGGTA